MADPRSPYAALQDGLAQRTPLLPPAQLRSLVEALLAERPRWLGGLRERPSPLYLLDPESLRTRARALRSTFEAVLPGVGCFFAVKSNHHPEVCRTLLREGLGLDVSSGLELSLALELGAREIVFSGPGKTAAELRLAVRHPERVTVLIDSPNELQQLERVAGEEQTRIRAGVRLAADPRGLWRKFGVPLEELTDFWTLAARCQRVDLCGLQFHRSWNRTPEPTVAFIAELGSALARAPAGLREAIQFLDVGGGFWPEVGEWLQPAGTPEGAIRSALGLSPGEPLAHHALLAVPIEEHARAIAAAVHEHLELPSTPRICVEPGRWLCHEAMHLLLTVVDQKGDALVITDAGTNAVGWERFEQDYFPVINLTRPSLEERECLVLGSLCTPHDVWGTSYFGASIGIGDVLLVPHQGAYTYSLRQSFIKPVPEVVAV